MEDILIGLFLALLAKLIKNPHHAAQYEAQLEHIDNGIQAILAQLKATENVPK